MSHQFKGRETTVCTHDRMVDDQLGEDGQRTGQLICRECGAVLSIPGARKVEKQAEEK
ncbi:hypothetical protein [Nitrospira sp. BLG_2]|uniref:hypothetical protein n=1 Tax=Nitrospira sp. BLG_2 TaxID=3397507 RepID=UPI003B9D61B2